MTYSLCVGAIVMALLSGEPAEHLTSLKAVELESPALYANPLAWSFSPDNTMIAGATSDGQIHVWNPKTGRVERLLCTVNGGVKWTGFCKGGLMLVSLQSDKTTINIWDTRAGTMIKEIKIADGSIGFTKSSLAIMIDPDGTRIVAGIVGLAEGKRSSQTIDLLRSWDAVTGKLDWELKSIGIHAIAFSPESSNILAFEGVRQLQDGRLDVAYSNSSISIIDSLTGRRMNRIPFKISSPNHVLFLKQGEYAAAVGPLAIELRESKTGRPVSTMKWSDSREIITDLIPSKDGAKFASVGIAGKYLDLIDVSTSTPVVQRSLIFNSLTVAVSPDLNLCISSRAAGNPDDDRPRSLLGTFVSDLRTKPHSASTRTIGKALLK